MTSARHRVVFVTGNKNKLEEVRQILDVESLNVDLVAQSIDLPELQGESTQSIAVEKCTTAAETLGCSVLTEDTSLCFEALNGLPGPYIKWFLKSIGLDGLNKLLVGFESTNAYALCTFAYCKGPGHQPIVFEGRTDGNIVSPRGPTTFGWDPVFQPASFNQTYAEMEKSLKNTISHRYKALMKVKDFFQTLQ